MTEYNRYEIISKILDGDHSELQLINFWKILKRESLDVRNLKPENRY